MQLMLQEKETEIFQKLRREKSTGSCSGYTSTFLYRAFDTGGFIKT